LGAKKRPMLSVPPPSSFKTYEALRRYLRSSKSFFEGKILISCYHQLSSLQTAIKC
jgi:hypothetical protein